MDQGATVSALAKLLAYVHLLAMIVTSAKLELVLLESLETVAFTLPRFATTETIALTTIAFLHKDVRQTNLPSALPPTIAKTLLVYLQVVVLSL